MAKLQSGGVNRIPAVIAHREAPARYLGNLAGRVSIQLVHHILSKHPEWHFVSFGAKKWSTLRNEHIWGWQSQGELQALTAELDAGFMAYNCDDPKNLHCVPLKLFDYFARGLPVVSTPISYLQRYEDPVYLGSTAEQLEQAVSKALIEPAGSPKKAKRKSIAEQHSVENVSCVIESILDEHIE